MQVFAGILCVFALFGLGLIWWLRRLLPTCACGRCRQAITILPQCLVTSGATLQFLSGPMAGTRVPIEGKLTIGSVAPNTIVLSDPAVSEHHVVIQREARHVVVRDLGATNPVLVNDQPVREVIVASGDKVRIGNSIAQIQIH